MRIIRFPVIPRLLALWLALALAWPSPAVALRPRAGGLEERTAATAELTRALASPALPAAGLEEIPQPTADELAGWLSLAPMSEAGRRLYGPLVELPRAEQREIAETVAKTYRVFGRHFQRTARYLVRTRGQGVEDTKPDGSPVLPQDKTVQRRFNRLASLTIPRLAIIGEEGSVLNPAARWWVTRDPLDGTRNYRPPLPGDPPVAYPSHYLSTMTLCYRLDAGRMIPVLTMAVAPQYVDGQPLWLVTGLGIDGMLVNGEIVRATADRSLRELVAGVTHISGSEIVNQWYVPAMHAHARQVIEYPDTMAMWEIPLSVANPNLPSTLAIRSAPVWDTFPMWHLTEALGGAVLDLRTGLRFQPTFALLAPGQTATTPALVYAVSKQAADEIRGYRPAAGLEEPTPATTTDRGDPTVAAPDPATATPADVAKYLWERWRVPTWPTEKGQYIVDQWAIPAASWTMLAIHDPVPGRIIEDVATMPVRVPVYSLKNYPTFSVPGTNSFGVYLGFVGGVDHPVVIKITNESGRWRPGDADEVVDAQLLRRQGIVPEVYGVIRDAEGYRGYVMQTIPGQSLRLRDVTVALAHPDGQAMRRRADEAGLRLPTIVKTVIDRYAGIDAGNAEALSEDRRTAWIVAQNAGWAIHELPVTGVAPTTEQAYLLSNAATLAALALLKVPGEMASLPVIAVVDPARLERLRAMAQRGGFSAGAIKTWEDRYVLPYHPNGPDDLQMATVEATAALAKRLGRDTVVPTCIDKWPEALSEFQTEWFKLLQGFGISLETGTEPWYPEAIQDLYRAAQA